MLPEKRPEAVSGTSTENSSVFKPTLLGGDTMISPVLNSSKKIEAYEVVLPRPDGGKVTFRISIQQGEDLIAARLSMLAGEVAQEQIISDEAFQSLLPAYVAEEYRKKLIEMGTPESDIPKTVPEMIEKAKNDLIAYRELGKEQIANMVQQTADEMISIVQEVLKGNKLRYNNLPPEFKKEIDFLRPTFSALALQNSNVTRETLEAQKMALAINLMSQEKYRDIWIEHFKATAAGAGDMIGSFFGNLFGTAYGATVGSAKVTYEKVIKKRNN